ncbi:MAG: hypothetical protein KDE15_12255 [Erythrobacter sp.]|nr:hypothetical protein [Erythrobacter sp.]
MTLANTKLAITQKAGKGALALAAGMAALAMVPTVAEAGTVVASSGPSAASYRVGSQVSDTQRITLQAGDTVTVLSGGSTRVLRGPGTYTLSQGGAATTGNQALAALTARRGGQARVASSRGEFTDEARNPNVWYVDVMAGGRVCLSNVSRVNLWRGGDRSVEANFTIAPTGSADDAVNLHFPATEMLARWDSALQISGGQSYTITNQADGSSVQVTFALLSSEPADPESLAQALISNGCDLQLAQIVSTAEVGSESGG